MKPSRRAWWMSWVLIAPLVSTAAPTSIVGFAPEPVDAAVQFRAQARTRGQDGPAAELVCRPLSEGVSLCFTHTRDGKRSYVTQADLSGWGMDVDGLERRARDLGASGGFTDGRPQRRTVEGVTGTYWYTGQADGLDATGLVLPDRLAKIAGGSPCVGIPSRDVLLFWLPGNAEFDKVMAVGVRRMHEAAEHPVSSLIYRWDGTRWGVWGQAVPSP